jgi:hypothetical protein
LKILIQFFNHNLKKAMHHLSKQHLQSFLGLERQRTNISRKDWNNFYKEIGEYTVGPLILQTPKSKFTWKNILQVCFLKKSTIHLSHILCCFTFFKANWWHKIQDLVMHLQWTIGPNYLTQASMHLCFFCGLQIRWTFPRPIPSV